MIKVRIIAFVSLLLVLGASLISLDYLPAMASTVLPQESCFSFISQGKAPILPGKSFFAADEDLLSAANSSIATWETYTGDVFGDGKVDSTVAFAEGDGVNTITFGPTGKKSAISYYQVAHYTDGSHGIIEWDIVLNYETEWGDAYQNSNLVDMQALMTHELGHALGLDHPGDWWCRQEMMFDTFQTPPSRYLGAGDIAGIEVLYP